MNRYQRARERSGFTQKEFGELIGVEPSVISRYETDIIKNAIVPSKERRERMAAICGISLEFLENDNPKMKAPLTLTQSAKFREFLKEESNLVNLMQKDVVIQIYGNVHPFRYLMRERWKPIVEDVYYFGFRLGRKVFDPDLFLEEKVFPEDITHSVTPAFVDPTIGLTDDELMLDADLQAILNEHYRHSSDSDILKRINEIASTFSREQKLDLLRLVQKRFLLFDAKKPSQDPERPETV